MKNLFGEKSCTRGHEYQCVHAQCGDCHCDCGGENHGKSVKRMYGDGIKIISDMNHQINNEKVILDLCGGTGSWARPYKEAGYQVITITLPEYDITKTRIEEDRIFFRHQDGTGRYILCKNIYGILAAPPCTMFSMARTTAKTPRDFSAGMECVKACLEIIWAARAAGGVKFWALENPTAYLRQFLGKPQMTFQPYEFGDRHKKRTDLWGYYNAPKKKLVTLTEEEILASRNNTRPLPKILGMKLTVAARRAITPAGFATAFFVANK